MIITDLSQSYMLRDLQIDDAEPPVSWCGKFGSSLNGVAHTVISYPSVERLMRAVALDYTEYLSLSGMGPIAWTDITCTVADEVTVNGTRVTATVTLHLVGEHFPVHVVLSAWGSACGDKAYWSRGGNRQKRDATAYVVNAYREINSADGVAGMVHGETDPMRGIKRHACAVVRTELDKMLTEADGDPRVILRQWRQWRATEVRYNQQVELDTVGA